MARPGISYEQVAAAADALVATGQKVTIDSVRQKLGTGSPNTIHQHLKTWRAARPVAPVAALVLPQALTVAFASELEKAAAQARASMEEELVSAREEADALAVAGEQQEEEKAALAESVVSLTTERDKLAGQVEIQAKEIQQLQEELERQTKALQQAHVDMAKLQIKDDMYADKAAEQTKEIQRLRDLVESAQSASREAVRQAAVLEAQLKASEERAQRAETAAQHALQEQTKTVNATAQSVAKLQTDHEARMDAARAQTQEALRARDEAMASGNTAREQAARLAGQLEMLEKQVQQMREAAAADRANSKPAT